METFAQADTSSEEEHSDREPSAGDEDIDERSNAEGTELAETPMMRNFMIIMDNSIADATACSVDSILSLPVELQLHVSCPQPWGSVSSPKHY